MDQEKAIKKHLTIDNIIVVIALLAILIPGSFIVITQLTVQNHIEKYCYLKGYEGYTYIDENVGRKKILVCFKEDIQYYKGHSIDLGIIYSSELTRLEFKKWEIDQYGTD